MHAGTCAAVKAHGSADLLCIRRLTAFQRLTVASVFWIETAKFLIAYAHRLIRFLKRHSWGCYMHETTMPLLQSPLSFFFLVHDSPAVYPSHHARIGPSSFRGMRHSPLL
jgi:hypothetical protein